MFTEYLHTHSMLDLLTKDPTPPFPPASNRAVWENLPEEIKADLDKTVAMYKAMEYPQLKATQFMAFVRTGDRKAWENPYFARRKKLIAAVVGYCLSHDPADLDEVIDGIWLVCEETSWVLSAHNGYEHRTPYHSALPDKENPYIDLFAGQTSMIISLIDSLIGPELDEVSPRIRRRMQYELETRIIKPFMTHNDFWWMGIDRDDVNNWNPWVLSDVMLTVSLTVKDRRQQAEALTRAARLLDNYLRVMPEDGGCDEGAAYWNMAGGALLDALELLWRVTDHQMDFFWQDRKIQRILAYPAEAQLGNGWFVNFADCDARPWISGARLQFAGEMTDNPALIQMGQTMRLGPGREISDTAQFFRLLCEVFHPQVAPVAADAQPKDVWLPDLQIHIKECGNLTLVTKAGSNGDSHNHNDVGSFMVFSQGEAQLIDVGNMVYTAKTFSSERYTLWNTRSMYHNVPLIGGVEQVEGKEHAASNVTYLPEGLSFDYEAAYPAGTATKATRKMTITPDGIKLWETIATPEPQEITWVFMLRNQPTLKDGQVDTGVVTLHFAPDMEAVIEEIPVTDQRMAKNFPGTVWRLMLTSKPTDYQERLFTIVHQ